MSAAILLEGVSKSFGATQAVRGVSLEIEHGSAFTTTV